MFAQVTQFPFTVGVKHSKTASNLLKPMEQSKIITQELETTEKSSIFDVEVVTKEHPKTSTIIKIHKKETKIITQQPKKIKFYKKSKAPDLTLQLYIIKIHILSKKCS